MTTAQQNTNAQQIGNTTQQSQSTPWNAVNFGQLFGSFNALPTSVTPAQAAASANLIGAANSLPNYGPTAANTANSFLTGDPTGLLQPAYQALQTGVGSSYNNLQNQLNPIANQNINPQSNPIIQQMLQNINQQVTTATNANAAGAGRSLNSGDNAGATAFNLASAELPALLGQYNTNQQNVMNAGNSLFTGGMNAANSLFSGGQATAGAETGNIGQGLNIASAVPSYYLQNPTAQLQAANVAQQLYPQNIAQKENLLIPAAGLGGQTSGSGTSNMNTQAQTTFTPSMLSDISQIAGILGGTSGGLFGGLSNFGNAVGGVNTGLSGLAQMFAPKPV